MTLQLTLRHFGKGSWQRVAVAQRLERIYRVAAGTGQLGRFVVFGSFSPLSGSRVMWMCSC